MSSAPLKLKLDENLGLRGIAILRGAGLEVSTVLEQALCAAADATLAEVCRIEGRVLVSLDKDFANTLPTESIRGPGRLAPAGTTTD